MNKLVSVIVPVYNAEKYLDKTIDSILSQTYTNLEVILVDDGSKDKSLEICNNYKEKDNRVKVFHKENGGVSSARNLGLDNAKGDYVCFCDSDDRLGNNMIEILVEVIKKTNVNMVNCGMFITEKGKEKYVSVKADKLFDINNDDDLYETLFSPELNASSVWNKIFVRENIGNIRFVEGVSWGEDQIFIQEFLLKNNKFFCIKDCLYNYVRDNSTLSINLMKDFISKSVKLNSYRDLFLKKLKVENRDVWNQFYWTLIKALFAGMSYERKYNELDVVKQHFNDALNCEFVKETIKNFEPNGLMQKFVYKCVKNKKFKLSHFVLSIRNLIKGKR